MIQTGSTAAAKVDVVGRREDKVHAGTGSVGLLRAVSRGEKLTADDDRNARNRDDADGEAGGSAIDLKAGASPLHGAAIGVRFHGPRAVGHAGVDQAFSPIPGSGQAGRTTGAVEDFKIGWRIRGLCTTAITGKNCWRVSTRSASACWPAVSESMPAPEISVTPG